MPSVAFVYNGSDTLTATITGATVGQTYGLWTDAVAGSTDSQTAVASTLVLTISDLAPTTGQYFDVVVQHGTVFTTDVYLGATIFQEGSTDEYPFDATWAFDGDKTVTVTAVWANGVNYFVQLLDSTHGGSSTTSWTGSGISELKTVAFGTTATGTYFYGYVYESDTGNVPTNRLFTAGVAGSGVPGNPAVTEGGGGGEGIMVAFGSDALDDTPVYTRIDDPAGISVVDRWSLRRGRSYVLDRMEAGTASINFRDIDGTLDPTNSGGPFYPMNPNCPAAIEVRNPVTDTFVRVFTGLVQACPQQINVDPPHVNRGSLELADLFSLLAIREVPPGLDFDDTDAGTSTGNTTGDTTYAATDIQSRIKAILADAGVPAGLTDIFTGNVNAQFTVEAPGTSILAALQDAADAEFPGVANIYVDKDGIVTFHGRRARFNPNVAEYRIATWHAGDTANTVSNDWALLQSLDLDRDVTKIINAARYTPQGILDADIAGQLVDDGTSIISYGPRTLSGDDLLTAGGLTDGLDANDETKLFATYYVDNFKDPQTRVTKATFRSLPTSHPRAAKTWALILGVELNDIVEITTTHPGGGGFSAEPYFVEGISMNAEILPPEPGETEGIWDITCTLDLSSKNYFTTEPWDDDHT